MCVYIYIYIYIYICLSVPAIKSLAMLIYYYYHVPSLTCLSFSCRIWGSTLEVWLYLISLYFFLFILWVLFVTLLAKFTEVVDCKWWYSLKHRLTTFFLFSLSTYDHIRIVIKVVFLDFLYINKELLLPYVFLV